MLNTRSEEENTGFYLYVACFLNTLTWKMYGFLSYTGLTRRNTFLYSCGRATRIREYVFNTSEEGG